MTEKLYNKSAYIHSFFADVISCTEYDGGYDILLDKTAFFPEGGGQSSDKGKIGGIDVLDVREQNGIIHHYTREMIEPSSGVFCSVDFCERFEKMQCHTAEHIVSGLLHSLFGIENVGFHLGSFYVTLDTSREVSAEELAKTEALANEAVYKNAVVSVKYPSADELDKLEYRSKLELEENVRIVDIEGYDSCACCAPHVELTGEVGYIKFIDSQKHKSGSRITMLAGKRAYEYMNKIYAATTGVSVLLSSPNTDIDKECKKLLDSKSELEYKLSSALSECASEFAKNVAPADKNAVFFYPMLDMSALRVFANSASEKIGGVLVALTGEEGSYKYILMYEGDDFTSVVSYANAALGGKGGGRAPMATGTYSASLEKIKEYFNLFTRG